MMTVADMKDKLSSIVAEAQALSDVSATESRVFSADEQVKFDALMASADALDKQIANAERMAIRAAALNAPGVRKTDPADTTTTTAAPRAGSTSSTIEGGYKTGASKGTGGYQNMGEFALSIRAARITGTLDHRLVAIRNAASTYGSEAVGGDGGYAIPPDFRSTILKKVQGEESLLALTDQFVAAGNEVVMPVDEATPWASTGGIQVSWLGEGSAVTQSKPALKAFRLQTNKIAALVPVTDELLSDAGTIDGYIASKVPDKMTYAINNAIVNGTGIGQPSGILGANSTVSQPAEGGQTAGTINYANIVKMWSRMYAPSRRNGVWLINQDVEPQLFSMVVTGGSPALPAYLPPGGLSDKPYGMLMGRPVVYSEACQPVGTPGDIIFADLKQYATVLKAGGVRTDVSVHLYFDADQTVFRVIMRVGGMPWWATSIPRAKSALPLSWAVTLAAR